MGDIALQIALDLISLSDALSIARHAVAVGGERIVIEAGTPLIKSEGISAVKKLRMAFPHNRIVADMKTMDAGALEAAMAFEAGADYTTVMYLAGETTLREAVEVAQEYGRGVIVDLMNTRSPLEAAKIAERLGASMVCFHIGIDAQKRLGLTAEELIQVVHEAKKTLSVPISVAGGIKPPVARRLAGMGVDVIIVGGYVTRSEDPASAVRTLLEAIT